MAAEALVEELRSRWGLPPIPTIKLVRELTGTSVGVAKTLVDRTLPADQIAARDKLIEDLTESFMADLAVEGAQSRGGVAIRKTPVESPIAGRPQCDDHRP